MKTLTTLVCCWLLTGCAVGNIEVKSESRKPTELIIHMDKDVNMNNNQQLACVYLHETNVLSCVDVYKVAVQLQMDRVERASAARASKD